MSCKHARAQAKPLLVIVNADDFGASAEINGAICAELASRRVTSATLMANGPAFLEAAQRVREFPACSFGVHLNVTEHPPLTASPHLKALLDSDGNLHSGLRYRLFSPRELHAIYMEFAAQIRRALQAGVPVSHLDSHWHIHTRPDFLPILRALQLEFGIERVRARLNIYPVEEQPSLRNRLAIPLVNAALGFSPRRRTTDRMCALRVFLQQLSSGHCCEYGSIELMVHPGLADPAYRAEAGLLSGWTDAMRRPFRLGTFWDL